MNTDEKKNQGTVLSLTDLTAALHLHTKAAINFGEYKSKENRKAEQETREAFLLMLVRTINSLGAHHDN